MGKYWFKPKRVGWGISYPISWQGWICLLIFVAVLLFFFLSNDFTQKGSWITFVVEALVTYIVYAFLLKNKVEGGLKWRRAVDLENKDSSK